MEGGRVRRGWWQGKAGEAKGELEEKGGRRREVGKEGLAEGGEGKSKAERWDMRGQKKLREWEGLT